MIHRNSGREPIESSTEATLSDPVGIAFNAKRHHVDREQPLTGPSPWCRHAGFAGHENAERRELPKKAVLVFLDNLTVRLRSHRTIKVLQVPGHAIRYPLSGERRLPNGKLPPTLARRHTTLPREDYDPKLRDYP